MEKPLEECHSKHFPISMHPMWVAGDTHPAERGSRIRRGRTRSGKKIELKKKITYGYFVKVWAKLLIALQVAD